MAVHLTQVQPDPRAHIKVQPALFDQRAFKPVDEHRYQRGYTPERMAAVNKGLAHVRFQHDYIGHGPEHEAQLRQNIARSTANPKQFKELQSITWHSSGSKMGRQYPGTAAHVTTVRDSADLHIFGMGERSVGHMAETVRTSTEAHQVMGKEVSPREVQDMTLMHEMGHVARVPAMREKVWGKSGYKKTTAAQRNQAIGSEERNADRYAARHYRPDPREVRRGTGGDPTMANYPARFGVRGGLRGTTNVHKHYAGFAAAAAPFTPNAVQTRRTELEQGVTESFHQPRLSKKES